MQNGGSHTRSARSFRIEIEKKTVPKENNLDDSVRIDHNYLVGNHVEVNSSSNLNESWKVGRRVVEFSVLVDGLKCCSSCRLGPMPLCLESVVGELKKGLGGYLYIKCLNIDCGHVNCVPYGKLIKGNKERFTRPTSFAVNTKLGTEIGLQGDVDIKQVPEAVPRGDFKPVKLVHSTPAYIVLDLETTDLIRSGRMPHITQIAAKEVTSGSEFSTYVLPKEPISDGAHQTTGISVSEGVMSMNGAVVQSASIQCAVDNLLKWLRKYEKVVIVAHNGRKFDFPILVSSISNVNKLEDFFTCVIGCIDTLSLFRKTFTNRVSFKQEDLARDILCLQYNAHDAVEDVRTLVKLFQHSCSLVPDVMKFSFSVQAVFHNFQSLKEKAKNIPSLRCLVSNSVCKMPTAENIAASGLNLEHLKLIYSKDGEDGLHSTFTSKNSEGQPRVTNTKRNLETLVPNLVDFLKQKCTQ